MAKRGRRISPQRLRRVEEIARRLIHAIEREPLLVRLPGERELAGLLGAAVREVRMAAHRLVEQGVLASAGRTAYRIVGRPDQPPPLQSVIVVNPRVSFNSLRVQCIFKGADGACRRHGLAFQARWARGEGADLEAQLEAMAVEAPGRHVGWLLGLVPPEALVRRWLGQGRRLGLVDRVHPAVPLPAAVLDVAGAIKLAIEQVVALGHVNLAFLARRPDPPNEVFFRDRDYSFDRAWSQNISWDLAIETVIEQTAAWAKRWQAAPAAGRPTAVVVFNIRLAAILHKLLAVAGVRTPEDLSLLALDCDWSLGWPDLSSFSLASMGDPADLGYQAVETLVRSADQAEGPPPISRLAASMVRPDLTLGPPPRPRPHRRRRRK